MSLFSWWKPKKNVVSNLAAILEASMKYDLTKMTEDHLEELQQLTPCLRLVARISPVQISVGEGHPIAFVQALDYYVNDAFFTEECLPVDTVMKFDPRLRLALTVEDLNRATSGLVRYFDGCQHIALVSGDGVSFIFKSNEKQEPPVCKKDRINIAKILGYLKTEVNTQPNLYVQLVEQLITLYYTRSRP